MAEYKNEFMFYNDFEVNIMNSLIQGFLIGLAYVAPIGMQNMYVINTAIETNRTRAFQVALITIFFDVTLALACYFGIGIILEHVMILRMIVLGIGSLAVIYIGISLMKATPTENQEQDYNKSLLKVIATCFVVTWLNPQAIIDGTLLLSGFRATLTGENITYFILGVTLASTTWFMSIAMIVTSFKKFFNHKILKVINVVCGIILVYFGIKLGIHFIQSL